MNGMTKWFVIGVMILTALIGAMSTNDHLSRTRDEILHAEVAEVRVEQAQQFGSIQTSLMRIETRLGIDD